jgi:hypothetical protein
MQHCPSKSITRTYASLCRRPLRAFGIFSKQLPDRIRPQVLLPVQRFDVTGVKANAFFAGLVLGSQRARS